MEVIIGLPQDMGEMTMPRQNDIDLAKYSFALGRPNPVKHLASAADALDLVEKAKRFLAGYQRNDQEGIYWEKPGYDDFDPAIYGGSAGLSYFYLKSAQSTGNPEDRNIALQSALYLAHRWEYVATHPPRHFIDDEGEGGYYGIAGIGFVLAEAYREFGHEAIRQALADMGRYYERHASSGPNGVWWTDNISLMGDGAVILFLLELGDLLHDERPIELARKAGEQLLSWGRRTSDGGLEFNSFSKIQPFSEPNFELGTAGAGYILLVLFEHTHDERYRDAALGAWKRLEAIKRSQGRGFLIPYRLDEQDRPLTEDGRIVYYLGTCHGPAGTARFYYKLYQVTKDRRFWDQIVALADGVESLGAPERQSAGYWNSYTYCCGPAALLQWYIALLQVDGSSRWLRLAERAADVLAGLAEEREGDAVDWPVAWTRIEPEVFSRRIGYFDGAAGIASTLLQYALVKQGKFVWSRLPDDPFPDRPLPASI